MAELSAHQHPVYIEYMDRPKMDWHGTGYRWVCEHNTCNLTDRKHGPWENTRKRAEVSGTDHWNAKHKP